MGDWLMDEVGLVGRCGWIMMNECRMGNDGWMNVVRGIMVSGLWMDEEVDEEVYEVGGVFKI